MTESDILVDELWVVIDGFPKYQVSNYGRVVNSRGMELRPKVDAWGFCSVALYSEGKRRDIAVHRLVAQAFFVDYHGDVEVYHINENRSDNTVLNLSLGSMLRIQVRVCDTDLVFASMKEAAEAFDGTPSGIYRALKTGNAYRGVRFEVVDIHTKA